MRFRVPEMNADKQKIMQDTIAALQTNDSALKKMLQCSNVSEQDCLLEKKQKNMERCRSGISATISRCCPDCHSQEAAP